MDAKGEALLVELEKQFVDVDVNKIFANADLANRTFLQPDPVVKPEVSPGHVDRVAKALRARSMRGSSSTQPPSKEPIKEKILGIVMIVAACVAVTAIVWMIKTH